MRNKTFHIISIYGKPGWKIRLIMLDNIFYSADVFKILFRHTTSPTASCYTQHTYRFPITSMLGLHTPCLPVWNTLLLTPVLSFQRRHYTFCCCCRCCYIMSFAFMLVTFGHSLFICEIAVLWDAGRDNRHQTDYLYQNMPCRRLKQMIIRWNHIR